MHVTAHDGYISPICSSKKKNPPRWTSQKRGLYCGSTVDDKACDKAYINASARKTTNRGKKKVHREIPRELKQKQVLFLFLFSVPRDHPSSGRGGGASGCGAKITPSGGEVWLSSPSRVAMMLRPANERPASAFMPAAAPKGSTNLT